MKKLPITLITILFSLFIACSKDDSSSSSSSKDGSTSSIKSYLGNDAYQALLENKFRFFPGEDPPNIEGSFLVSKAKLLSSNVAGDQPGNIFNDYYLDLFNQTDFSIDYEGGHRGSQKDEGSGAYLVGEGNDFSVILKTKSKIQGYDAKTAILFSGTMTSSGIRDIKYAFIMLDNYGNPGGILLKNNKCRVIVDSDGLAENM